MDSMLNAQGSKVSKTGQKPAASEKIDTRVAVAGLIGGFLVMVLGFTVGFDALGGLGAVVSVLSLIWLNSSFWAGRLTDEDIKRRLEHSDSYYMD